MNPFFSVIIPSYNRADTISQAIQSVVSQTFEEWELLVVDDGSTDNTSEVLGKWQDNRITMLHIPHSERSAARNTGMSHARGEFLCFLDSDDFFLPTHLETLAARIRQSSDYAIFRTGAWLTGIGECSNQCFMEQTDETEPFPFECIQTFAFRRSFVMQFSFQAQFDGVAEDFYFLLEAGRNQEIQTIPAWTVVYRQSVPVKLPAAKLCTQLEKKITCLDQILSWNHPPIADYLRRQRCLASLYMAVISWPSIPLLLTAFRHNIASLMRYPTSFLRVCLQKAEMVT